MTVIEKRMYQPQTHLCRWNVCHRKGWITIHAWFEKQRSLPTKITLKLNSCTYCRK